MRCEYNGWNRYMIFHLSIAKNSNKNHIISPKYIQSTKFLQLTKRILYNIFKKNY